MKRFFSIFSLLLCVAATAVAQSFTQHIQEQKPGKASVSVTQSHEIDALVNTANVSARKQEPAGITHPAQQKTSNTPTTKQNIQEPQRQHTTPLHNSEPTHTANREQTAHHDSATRHDATQAAQPSQRETRKTEQNETETEAPVVDMRKKVMRRSYKVNGYRVQVFAGGNSRNDKIKAQNAGNAVKMAFPSQPVYVHFYSPRWICRVGNFRTYEEANAILHQVKKMGYKQACIVSGKINVAY